jgi:sugar phosphate isomerase/epimerase
MTRVGLQLYTVRGECDRDLEGTLRTVASLGYDGVELYDLHGRSAADVRDLLGDVGLDVAGRHVSLDVDVDELADEQRVLGCDRVALAWIDPVSSVEERDAAVERIVDLGERVRAAGLRFGFHNHWTETESFDDGASLVARLPEWVWLELDLGWAWWAGTSPVELLDWARGRTPLVHAKDLRARGSRDFVPVGDGGVGYEEVVRKAAELGVEWVIVEQDELDRPPADALERSLAAVRGALAGVA